MKNEHGHPAGLDELAHLFSPKANCELIKLYKLLRKLDGETEGDNPKIGVCPAMSMVPIVGGMASAVVMVYYSYRLRSFAKRQSIDVPEGLYKGLLKPSGFALIPLLGPYFVKALMPNSQNWGLLERNMYEYARRHANGGGSFSTGSYQPGHEGRMRSVDESAQRQGEESVRVYASRDAIPSGSQLTINMADSTDNNHKKCEYRRSKVAGAKGVDTTAEHPSLPPAHNSIYCMDIMSEVTLSEELASFLNESKDKHDDDAYKHRSAQKERRRSKNVIGRLSLLRDSMRPSRVSIDTNRERSSSSSSSNNNTKTIGKHHGSKEEASKQAFPNVVDPRTLDDILDTYSINSQNSLANNHRDSLALLKPAHMANGANMVGSSRRNNDDNREGRIMTTGMATNSPKGPIHRIGSSGSRDSIKGLSYYYQDEPFTAPYSLEQGSVDRSPLITPTTGGHTSSVSSSRRDSRRIADQGGRIRPQTTRGSNNKSSSSSSSTTTTTKSRSDVSRRLSRRDRKYQPRQQLLASYRDSMGQSLSLSRIAAINRANNNGSNDQAGRRDIDRRQEVADDDGKEEEDEEDGGRYTGVNIQRLLSKTQSRIGNININSNTNSSRTSRRYDSGLKHDPDFIKYTLSQKAYIQTMAKSFT